MGLVTSGLCIKCNWGAGPDGVCFKCHVGTEVLVNFNSTWKTKHTERDQNDRNSFPFNIGDQNGFNPYGLNTADSAETTQSTAENTTAPTTDSNFELTEGCEDMDTNGVFNLDVSNLDVSDVVNLFKGITNSAPPTTHMALITIAAMALLTKLII